MPSKYTYTNATNPNCKIKDNCWHDNTTDCLNCKHNKPSYFKKKYETTEVTDFKMYNKETQNLILSSENAELTSLTSENEPSNEYFIYPWELGGSTTIIIKENTQIG